MAVNGCPRGRVSRSASVHVTDACRLAWLQKRLAESNSGTTPLARDVDVVLGHRMMQHLQKRCLLPPTEGGGVTGAK